MNPQQPFTGNQGNNRAFDDLYQNMNVSTPVQPVTPNYNTLEVTTNGVCKKFIHGKCRQSA